MSQLITPKDLATRLDRDALMVFDTRASLDDPNHGRHVYEERHIPGAIFLDLEQDLSGTIVPGRTGRHPLPEPGILEARLREVGLRQMDDVVVYDDGPGFFAARLWWLLRWLGHHRVQVLDGGFRAWSDADLPVRQSKEVRHWPGDFVARVEHHRVIDSNSVLAHLEDGSLVLLDARSPERFRGEQEPIDPVAGHIPGAHCLPCGANLDKDGRFLPAEQLLERFTGLPQQGEKVSYCGSGVTACHNILAAVESGLLEPKLYPGSWSEWITDPERPVATN